MVLKLAENEEYLEAKKEHDEMTPELIGKRKKLFELKCRLERLGENGGIDHKTGKPNWPEIDKAKKEYVETQGLIDTLQERIKGFQKFREIKEKMKPEALRLGLKINRKTLKVLKDLERLAEDYAELRKDWTPYDGLTFRNPNVEGIENTIGPQITEIFNMKDFTLQAFIERSKKYQNQNNGK